MKSPEITKRAWEGSVWSLLVTVWRTLLAAAALAEGRMYTAVMITCINSHNRLYGIMLTVISSMFFQHSISLINKCPELHHILFTNTARLPLFFLPLSLVLLEQKKTVNFNV